MNTNLILSKPSLALKIEYMSFYQEWLESGETLVPWVISKDPTNFEEMLQYLADRERGIPEGGVIDSTYWLIDENKRVLGAVNIRHQLNERLLERGGHIGYGIRPSERRKGYATRILALSLEIAKQLGIKKALVTCDKNNIASFKTIQKNGGVEDKDYIDKDGNIIKRCWIEI